MWRVWFCFCFAFVCSQERYHLERGDSFEIGRPRSRGWKNFGRRWARVGGLERWTIFVDAMCVLSLTAIVLKVLFESIGHVRQFSLIFAGWDHAITWLSCHVCIYELKSYWINLKFLNENEIFEWNYRNWQNNTKLKENLNYRMN